MNRNEHFYLLVSKIQLMVTYYTLPGLISKLYLLKKYFQETNRCLRKKDNLKWHYKTFLPMKIQG